MRKPGRKIIIAGVMAAIALVAATWFVKTAFFSTQPGVEPDSELYPVRGIDISAHNGAVDFEKVKADGYEFVIIKASEGTDFKDRNFTDNLRRAREAGLNTGAYHFFRFDTDGMMQALNLMHSLRFHNLSFPAVIDIEEWGNPDVIATRDIISNLRNMITTLEANGIDIILYSNKDGYDRFIKGNFDNYPLWISSFSEPGPDINWSIWQYSHSGKVDGTESKVDLNAIKPEFYRLLK